MGRIIDDFKPALAMLGLQFIFAGVNLFTTPIVLNGKSSNSMVFVFYGQLIATLFSALIAFISRREKLVRTSSLGLGLKRFGWILLLALFLGLVKISIESLASVSKILGTMLCVSGAMSTSLLPKSLFSLGGETLLVGCLLVFHSSIIWSCWNVLQVPARTSRLSSSCWMCFLAALHSGIIAILLERKVEAWSLNSYLELASCFYTGIARASVFYVQAWCISERGLLFSAMYQTLATGFVAFFAAIFLHREAYTGSLVGEFSVMIGLYVVLWGKAKDLEDMEQETDSMLFENKSNVVQVVIEEYSEKNCRISLENPLLS
ncbi:Drug/metabolite transporter [Corchorus olitorius]|uniref:Drug/metabolite transporter n=1 Tax=Corchorus olitorius TaxID=93759 RepID=A0A1R3KR19_9ROSI|nr:Drug/metabolite transporter [Corchorus olitorius]